jgi:hypothetical protein
MQGRSLLVRAVTLAILMTLAVAGAARADTLTVNGFNEDDGPCTAGVCPSIRSALGQAAALPGADTITLPAGDYVLSSALTVGSDVTLRGASARTTIVHGGDNFRVFEVSLGVTATISHLTMRDGTADNNNGCWGGNLRSEGTLLLDHIRSTGGEACSGAGIGNIGAAMTVRSSLIDSNSADIGGSDSGGILNLGRQDRPAQLTVRDTTIAFNYAGQIGGVFSWSYEGNIPNTTTLERVTLAYNSGGALRRADASQTFNVRGSVVQGNCAGGIASGGGNLESGSSCGFEVQNDGALVSDALTDMGGETNVVIPGSSTAWIDSAGACTGTDQRDVPRPQGLACDAGALELEPGVVISAGPSGATNQRDASFTFDGNGTGFQCRLDTPGDDGAFIDCASPQRYESLGDGAYRFAVRALDANASPGVPAVRNFVVDTAAPAAPVITGAGTLLTGTAEPNASIEILDGGAHAGSTTAGADGTWSYAIPAGAHTYTVRATDAAGNVSAASAPRIVAAVTQQPTPTPTPTPVFGKTVVGRPVSGKVLVKLPGKGFVELDATQSIPVGSTIDTKKGTISLTAKAGQTATFHDGIFKLTQTKTTTDLTLTEALAKCPKQRAAHAAAKKKPKTRKLWGNGSGSFRTRGQYSAATVRGTEWLVQDSCAGTLTQVRKGVVAVRDNVKRKTIVLRAGKKYLARPRKR